MRPGIPLITAWAGWSLAGLIPFFLPRTALFWVLAGSLLLLLMLADCIMAMVLRRRGTNVELDMTAPTVVEVNRPVRTVLKVRFSRGKNIRGKITIFQELPETVEAYPYPVECRAGDADSNGEIRIPVQWTPLRRGSRQGTGFRLEFSSPLGFFSCLERHERPFKLAVYPKLGIPGENQAFGTQRTRAGTVAIRRRGEGTDFKELRDYMQGDSIRRIDWRATSRRGHPIVRTYQEERDQQILIILDSGYRLHQKDGDTVQFDSALQAALQLSHTALNHGDSVGIYSYGHEERWVPPGKGRSHFCTLLNGVYDLESSSAAASPSTALKNVLGCLNRRTLLIFLTNLREEDGDVVEWMLPPIRGKHLMMTVTLQEEGAQGPSSIGELDDALLYGAVELYKEQRLKLRRFWEKQGLITLDARPSEVSGTLVHKYLVLKGAGVL